MKEKISFFKSLINDLEKQRINYVFLRRHEFIYDDQEEGEIDILVREKDLPKLREIFKKTRGCRESKMNIDLTHPFLVRVVREKFIVDLDFQINGIGYCGSAILKDNYLFEHIRKQKGFNVLDGEGRFLMLFVHGFIFKKKLDYFKKYEKEFFDLWGKVNRKKISKELTSIFNKKYSRKIIELIGKKDLKTLFKIKGKLVRIHLTKNPFEIFKVIVSKLMRLRNYFHLDRFFYFINPFKWAPLICFVGADGSGKSTMVKESKKYLDKFEIKNPLNSPNKVKSYSERISSEKKESSLKLFLRLILQMPKQIKIGYYRKRGFVVISDRYIYDLVFFYKAEGFFKSLVKILSQRPSTCFYVKADPEEILKRNDELSLDAIKSINYRINKNKKYFSLTDLENNYLKSSKKNLYKHLNKIIKNV